VLTYAEIATATAELDMDEADMEELHGFLERSEIELVEDIDSATAAGSEVERAPDKRGRRKAKTALDLKPERTTDSKTSAASAKPRSCATTPRPLPALRPRRPGHQTLTPVRNLSSRTRRSLSRTRRSLVRRARTNKKPHRKNRQPRQVVPAQRGWWSAPRNAPARCRLATRGHVRPREGTRDSVPRWTRASRRRDQPWHSLRGGDSTQQMTIRSGDYTALLETIGARAATKLHAAEREQLLAVADALLFGDPDSEQRLARALELTARLRESERWSAESCAELREHLHGCGALPAGP